MKAVENAINNMIEITPQEAYSVIYEARISKVPTTFYVVDGVFKHDNFSWVCKRNEQPNVAKVVQYCDLCYLDCGGGCIISCNDDFNIAISFPIRTTIGTYEKFDEILETVSRNISKELEVYCWRDNNDIVTEDGKVCGASFVNNDLVMKMEFSFSLVDHKPLIDEIGLPYEPNKAPSYLQVDKAELFEVWKKSILEATEDWDN